MRVSMKPLRIAVPIPCISNSFAASLIEPLYTLLFPCEDPSRDDMSSPSNRCDKDHSSPGGPSRSVLQRLLEEITDAGHERSETLARAGSSGASKRRSRTTERHHASVWVGGSAAAEDARSKLRAHDEARQRQKLDHDADYPTISIRLTQPNSRGDSTDTSSSTLSISSKHDSAIAISDAIFAHSPTPPSDVQRSSLEYSSSAKGGGKRLHSPTLVLKVEKRMRTKSNAEQVHSRLYSAFDTDDITIDNGDPKVMSDRNNRQEEYVQRSPPSSSSHITSIAPPLANNVPPSRSVKKEARGSLIPKTPCHSHVSPSSSQGPETPAWMQPFQLLEGEKPVFLQIHGQEERDNPLCLQCFRSRGELNTVLRDGCESCGKMEILKGHY